MFGFIFHMPFELYWFLGGLITAIALILIHDRWAKWFKIIAFLFTVLLPPVTIAVWVMWRLVLRTERPEVKP